MSIKLKALGLGLLAAMAMSAVAVVNAGATTGGHFTSEMNHTTIQGIESGNHQLHFVKEGGSEGERIGCINDSYSGTVTAATVTEIQITPSWSTCKTTGSATHFEIHENGCSFKFTVRTNPGTEHNTVHLECPPGNAVVITHPNCTITVPAQTVTGVTYPSDGAGGITLNSTVKNITTEYHGGICVFLGTSHKSEMVGSVAIHGTFNNNKVNISAT
jgi:hypothetical protein